MPPAALPILAVLGAAIGAAAAVVWLSRRAAPDRGELVDALREKEASLGRALAAAEARAARVPELEAEVEGLRRDRDALAVERARLEQAVANAEEKRATLAREFELLSAKALAAQGEAVAKDQATRLEGLLGPLRQKIAEFQKELQEAAKESGKERAVLGERIRDLLARSDRMTEEAGNLTRALRSRPEARGAWGEMVLATVLERSGLREGEEYVLQQSATSEDGARLRPDVLVRLPGRGQIVVDSKVSLAAFEAFVNAADEPSRASALRQHVDSIRGHVKDLASKDYARLDGGIDYVIMFVPIEGALAEALRADPDLTAFAAKLNVVVATPTTLLLALKTVAHVWQVERRNRNAEEIADRAGRLHDKFAAFCEDLDGLGNRLNQAREAYDGALAKLRHGRGNLLAQVAQLEKLGARTSKALPADGADDDDQKNLMSPRGTTTS